ncbi:MAG: sulfate transporter CysZ [Coxiella sp. RIFCSPHIGHO2_12_FULL_42_15]|nr:MAG: sulfate transporter CysZ [Coxiella sp. RIFCSPHIGHO2_12_FULL_42_15]
MSSWNYFIDGFRLIFKKGLRRYVVFPATINAVVFMAMFWYGGHEFHRLTMWFAHFLPSWLQWLAGVLWVLFVLVVLLIFVYTFSLVANLVAAPFNGFLAEKVEEHLRGHPAAAALSWRMIFTEAPRMLKRQLHFMGYYFSRIILVVILFFIPGLQVLAAPLWYLLSAWMMTVQYIDYPMDNHRIDFVTMRQMLATKRVLNVSFGALVLVASLIPLLNFIVIPAAVAGATQLWLHEYGSASSVPT